MKYKLTIAVSLCCFFILHANAQLANTQWKGSINIPKAHAILWKFDKDTVKVFFKDKDEDTEVMVYTEDVAEKKVSFTKISGTSPCASGFTGVYNYTTANDKLSLKPIQDTCTGRTSAVHGVFFTRVK
ncbi:MAG TPA: hypothetical protein VHD83_07000 [Puia sp.]|nr:hypothetical protein [Puia sp.]